MEYTCGSRKNLFTLCHPYLLKYLERSPYKFSHLLCATVLALLVQGPNKEKAQTLLVLA